MQTKVRTVKEAENLIFYAVLGIEGVVAASVDYQDIITDDDDQPQLEIGIEKDGKDFAPIYISARFARTASVDDITKDIIDELNGHNERGLYQWIKRTPTNGQDSSIGAS